MTVVYAAYSKTLAQWGAEVGLTKHIYKLGVADGPASAVADALNASRHAGADDWKLLAKREVDGADEAALIERLARSLGGTSRVEIREDGLNAEITFRLDNRPIQNT